MYPPITAFGLALRTALIWSAAVAGTTALISSVGRWFCLPPYWPPGFVGKCRPDLLGPSMVQLMGDAAITTVFLMLPSIPLGAGVHLLVSMVRARGSHPLATAGAALVGAGAWVWLARGLEASYLDFILGGYAIGAGALMGLIVSVRSGA